jgi:hypothetical protein
MSICRLQILKCPDCGSKIEAEVFDTINAQLNPERRVPFAGENSSPGMFDLPDDSAGLFLD